MHAHMSEYIGAERSARLAVTDSGDHIPLSSFLAVQDLSTVATDIFILSCHNSNDAQRNIGLDKATWTNCLAVQRARFRRGRLL